MTVTLLLAGATLRLGVRLRQMRQRGERRPPQLRRTHLKLAKLTVSLVALGFVAGPASAVWLRDWTPLGSFHGWVGTAVATLFFAAAFVGRKLERGESRALDVHGVLGLIAVLGGALAAIAGFVLLP